jgi:hypothetical protein
MSKPSDGRYGCWAGNPSGRAENKENCVQQMFDQVIGRQCSKKRGYGPDKEWCKQHAKKLFGGTNDSI